MIQVVSKYPAGSGALTRGAPAGCLAFEVFEGDDPAYAFVVTRWMDAAALQTWRAERPERPEHEEVLRRRERVLRSSEAAAPDGLAELTNELAVTLRETTRQQRTHWYIKKLKEVLPVCMGCGLVNADERGWQEALQFLKERAPFLSHGYCPECAERTRAELDRELEKL